MLCGHCIFNAFPFLPVLSAVSSTLILFFKGLLLNLAISIILNLFYSKLGQLPRDGHHDHRTVFQLCINFCKCLYFAVSKTCNTSRNDYVGFEKCVVNILGCNG